MLARALRRAGHEVLFVLSRQIALDRPENRYADIVSDACPWVFDAGALQDTEKHQFLTESALRDLVISRLRGCDAVVLNHSALSLAFLIGRPHIGLLTGTDIGDLADRGYVRCADGYTLAERLWLEAAIARQRAGIASAVAVSVPFRGLLPRFDVTLDALGVNADRRFYAWMSDPAYFPAAPSPGNERVRVFNVARLTWKSPSELEFTMDHKASDLMLRGLARFAERHPAVGLDIRLVRKGLQVADAEALIEALGLKSRVTWIEEMRQDEAVEECRRADIVFDQLGLSSVGMGGLDAMAIGRPVIGNARPDVMRHNLPELPICHAATEGEVAEQLERLVLSREERERVGRESRAYIEQHCSADAAAAVFARRLEAVISNPSPYSLWSETMMETRERLATEREDRLSLADARLDEAERAAGEREGRLAEMERSLVARRVDAERREGAILNRETLLSGREENAAFLAQERAELNRSWAAYEALRIVRWQRTLKAWTKRLTGRTNSE